MRLIKQQTTNARSITGKGYKYNLQNDIATVDANALLVPRGTTDSKPTLPINGFVRYNTSIEAFEFYVDGIWQVVRYKEPGLIHQQTLGPGNGQYIYFGPLNSQDDDFPEPFAAQNIIVLVENVFQISNTNYSMILNPSAPPSTGATIEAFYLVNGLDYVIVDAVDTDFTKVGAANNNTGTLFTADLSVEVTSLSEITGNAAGERFGYSVDVQNNGTSSYIITGAYKNATDGTDSGRVYIYDLSGTLIHTIRNPNEFGIGFGSSAEDFFGFSVAISNTYAVIGAFQEDAAVNLGVGDNNGKVYLYDMTNLNTNAPDYVLSISTSIGDGTDWFGYAVATTDTHCIIGAPKEEEVALKPSGKAFLYNLSDPVNNVIEISNPLDYDSGGLWFGSAVDISDNYVIVGTNPIEVSAFQNKVYIFNLNGDLLYTLTNPNITESADDGFGYSVAISNKFAIVGSFAEDVDGVSSQGVIYIYELQDTDPVTPVELSPKFYPNTSTAEDASEFLNDEFGGIINPNIFGTGVNDNFGYKVSVSGVYALVAAHTEDTINPNDPAALDQDSGVVYIFDLLTGELLASISNPDNDESATGDLFGAAMSITNTHLVVGAYEEATEQGAVYVWSIDGKALGSGLVRRTGQYLQFTSPVDIGKPITVLHNFDK